MNTLKINPQELRDIMEEYKYEEDIMSEEDERVLLMKKRISRLAPADKILICLYMNYESSRKVGKILGCSHSSILKEIHRIKGELLDGI